ncbi:HAMP domain-containing protein [Oculatella sp. LEGE 06141]|nr:HAMP domain-containing protein [Oculatella sp. LEGE 06141]
MVMLGTLPVLVVGGIATYIATTRLTQETTEERQRLANEIGAHMEEFVTDRLHDVEAIAANPMVIDPDVRKTVPPENILQYLESYIERDPTYSVITVAQADGGYVYLNNDPNLPFLTRIAEVPPEAYDPTYKLFAVRNVPYYLGVRDTGRPTLSVRASSVTARTGIFVAVPTFTDATRRQFANMVYSRTYAEDVSQVISRQLLSELAGTDEEGSSIKFSVMNHPPLYFEKTPDGKEQEILSSRIQTEDGTVKIDGQEFQPGGAIFTKQNQVFVSDDNQGAGVEMQSIFPKYAELSKSGVAATTTDVSLADGQKYLLTYAPVSQVEGLSYDWGVLLYEPTATAFAPQRTLVLTLLSGTLITAVLVAIVAAYLSNRATQPILEATQAINQLGQGDLDARLAIQGEDEIAQLGWNINTMADQLQHLIAQQEEATLQQTDLADQQRQEKEALQQELAQLLEAIADASSGDLTVRAELTAGEIGIIGDVFNSIIENLRKIVVQVKTATNQVNASVGDNESAIRQLADEALAQVDEITSTLNSVEQMSQSIQAVANSAREAAEVARAASTTAQDGGVAIEQTVASILTLRSTVAETARKVKQLGESSQQISQVVSLINEIAIKTNMLAVNASIEAAHAGEEGQGFAVVAREVGELAEKSAAATKEIEQIVKNIQTGTREVVEAMEAGTMQVVEGTQLVQETRKSLERIVEVSVKMDQLLHSISEATVSQAETSQTVANLMKQITRSSEQTSDSSRHVAGSLRQTVDIAQELQTAVGQFKVGTED